MNKSNFTQEAARKTWTPLRLTKLGTIADVANASTGTVENKNKGS